MSNTPIIRWKSSPPEGEVPNEKRIKLILILCVGLIVAGFLLDSPQKILEGLWRITINRASLLTDYIELSGIGAALVNSGLTTLLGVFFIYRSKANVSGPVLAAVLAVTGFAFFGKNIYNSIPIYLGVTLYARAAGVPFRSAILAALFGTCLGPAVSQVSFGFGLPAYAGVPLGYFIGIFIGFIMQPLASHFVGFHKGFNVYNIGFTSGIIGLFIASIFRVFGLQMDSVSILSSGNNEVIILILLLIFIPLFIYGYWHNEKSFKGYKELMGNSGRSVADFISLYGYGITLINMVTIGAISTVYVLLLGAQINGPILGAIFMVTGFGAFGKHPRNILPIILGVYLGSLIGVYDTLGTGVIIAALFGTALAPIAGQYGVVAGILAGFTHLAIVMNTGYLHGAMNLYNNGFSAGFVAGILVPLLDFWTNEIKGKAYERIIKGKKDS